MKRSGSNGAMMVSNTQIPKGWRQVQLGDVVQERNQRAGSFSELEVYSVTKYDGFVRSLEYFGRQVFSRDIRDYKLVHRRDLAYATIHLDEGSLGILRDAEAVVISPMYTVFEVDASSSGPGVFYSP